METSKKQVNNEISNEISADEKRKVKKPKRMFHRDQGQCTCACNECCQSCPTLCDLLDCSSPGSSVHVFQARKLEWVAIFYCRVFSDSVVEPESPASPALSGRFFTTAQPGKPKYAPV